MKLVAGQEYLNTDFNVYQMQIVNPEANNVTLYIRQHGLGWSRYKVWSDLELVRILTLRSCHYRFEFTGTTEVSLV